MMRPTSRLAAPVTGSASAPISCSSRGSERQSTDRGAAIALGTATAQRPMKSRAPRTVAGTSAAAAPIRGSIPFKRPGAAGRSALALEVDGDQSLRLRVAVPHQARAAAGGIQPVQESGEQRRAAAVDAVEMHEVDVDRVAFVEPRLDVLHGTVYRHRVGQVERTGWHHAYPVAVSLDTDVNAHALLRGDLRDLVPLDAEAGHQPLLSEDERDDVLLDVLVVVVFAMPSSASTMLGPTPTSKPLALSSSVRAFSFMKNIA